MERMQKLGIADLSKKLKSKPLPPLPKKSARNKNEIKNSEPTRRSSRLEKLTPVSYKYSRQNERRNHMEEEDEEDDEDEGDDGNYKTRARFNSDLCGRRSSRLQQVTRVNYTEISPKKRPETEDEAENGEVILVGEGGKPEMDTEEHEKGAEQPVSAKRYLPFDNVEHSLHSIESVNSSSDGEPLDPDVGEVTSS
ncbi:hypothetical protein MKW94_010912 [Papaver nudicaule]|uniref:Uncharacterized protein n=1 Tax=Papaver nudicaule TaxID=74823 RepID=A0AA41SC07_PAPNU|nr:hypothetical protein [Papaver nudicaule]